MDSDHYLFSLGLFYLGLIRKKELICHFYHKRINSNLTDTDLLIR